MGRLAIIAGAGALPRLLSDAGPAEIVGFAGQPSPEIQVTIPARFEALGGLFDRLSSAGVSDLCLAGAMQRPALDPAAMDDCTRALLPRLQAAMGKGDDALLRDLVAVLEERGFTVRGAHELRPDLLAPEGPLAGPQFRAEDAARGRAVLAALGTLDVGQATVVAQGQVIGIETLQGTDAMLDFVARTRPGSGGVMVKRAKPGQDLRVDMPAIGAETVRRAAQAGLTAIEVQAGHVLLLGRDAVRAACAETGLSLWAAP